MTRLVFVLALLLSACFVFASAVEETSAVPDTVAVLTWENDNAAHSILGEQPVIEFVEKKLNIKFDWHIQPQSFLSEQIALMIQSGSEIPDLFTSRPQGMTPKEMADNDIIIPFGDLIASGRMPLTAAKFAEDDAAIQSYVAGITSPEGKIYSLHRMRSTRPLLWTMIIRQDWMQQLGFENDPATLDEYAEILRAFVTQDPNGNGRADEIGWTTFMSGTGWLRFWYRPFGIKSMNYSAWSDDVNYAVENGQIYFVPTSDRYKAMLRWSAEMYEEGLFDPRIFNMDSPRYNMIAVDDTLGSQHMWPHSAVGYTLQMGETGAVNHVMLYPKSEMWYGNIVYANHNNISWGTYLAKDGNNVDAAIRVIDYLFGDNEFPVISEYGVEGEQHIVNAAGEREFIGKWADMEAAERRDALGTYVGRLPRHFRDLITGAKFDTDPLYADFRAFEEQIAPFKQPFPFWKLTLEQDTTVREVKENVDLNTYISEVSAKLIIGEASFDDWDDYVRDIDKVAGDDIARATEAYQEYFDENLRDSYVE
jgi:putative aldouronate transport system substrate-binding protein|tara:strand:- start:696 stop:2300 length:1605 start_codon:yes stop_codon:yes gene_type:complete